MAGILCGHQPTCCPRWGDFWRASVAAGLRRRHATIPGRGGYVLVGGRPHQPGRRHPTDIASARAGCLRLLFWTCSQSYKNGENIDLSNVATYARHENDTGSPEAQVARLTARVAQLSPHLQKNRKDHAAKRGLQMILNQRKKLLQYLFKQDRER
eukprot:353069-Chlamydomonas_euryale.AAC.31